MRPRQCEVAATGSTATMAHFSPGAVVGWRRSHQAVTLALSSAAKAMPRVMARADLSLPSVGIRTCLVHRSCFGLLAAVSSLEIGANSHLSSKRDVGAGLCIE
jgi:hypothetical protein